VLCMDEKSQIQALDRTQPSLPIKPGRAGTMTHDYKRNGTTTLESSATILLRPPRVHSGLHEAADARLELRIPVWREGDLDL